MSSEQALSALAHELKTPLAAITGFAELLQARADEHTRVEASSRILDASERLSAAIDRLLGLIEAEDEAVIRRLAEGAE